MTTQINIRLPEDFLQQARTYAQSHGFLNVQEFFREAAREKIYDDLEIKPAYLKRLESTDATTFLTEKEADQFEKKLNKAIRL